MKEETTVETLWEKHPKEFTKYFNYWRSLLFEDKPCISDLKKLFKNLLGKKVDDPELQFDWMRKKIPREITFEEEDAKVSTNSSCSF